MALRTRDRQSFASLNQIALEYRGRFFDDALLVNLLTLDAMDNISKQPDYKKCAVRLERV